jgi:hypothetical protein
LSIDQDEIFPGTALGVSSKLENEFQQALEYIDSDAFVFYQGTEQEVLGIIRQLSR